MIPIQIVTNSTLRIEKSYNNYKLGKEQQLVGSLASINSVTLGKKF